MFKEAVMNCIYIVNAPITEETVPFILIACIVGASLAIFAIDFLTKK